MTRVAAWYHPPDSSTRTEVELVLEPGRVRVVGDGVDRASSVEQVTFSARLGNVPRTARLPDGAQVEAADNDAIDAYLRGEGIGRRSAALHVLETRYRFVAIATLATAVAIWAFVEYGIPTLARGAAFALPVSVDARLGEDGLDLLDEAFLEPSALPDQRRADVDALFVALVAGVPAEQRDEHALRVAVRGGGPLGANALALPGGLVIVTDELIALAQSEDELRGVIAHELGHVVHRHGLQRLLQNAALVLLLGVITGDMTTFGSLAVAIPAVLVESEFSRDFEREADAFAVRTMREQGIPIAAYATMLRRLEGKMTNDVEFPGFLSTHPGIEERVQALERAAR